MQTHVTPYYATPPPYTAVRVSAAQVRPLSLCFVRALAVYPTGRLGVVLV